MGRGEGGGWGNSHFVLALVISPLTTHPFRDGALFLLLIDGGGGKYDENGFGKDLGPLRFRQDLHACKFIRQGEGRL